MAWITLLGMLSFCWAIPSSILCVLMYKYINCKPPGHQSVLDLIIKEYLIVVIARNFTYVFVHYLILLLVQVEATMAHAIVFVLTNLSGMECAYFQVLLLVKYLLIFNPNWFVDRNDSEVIWTSRRLVLVYSSFRFFIDFYASPKTFHTMSLLTGAELKTSFGPGLGMILMLVILLITFIALKIKTPKLPEDNLEDKDSIKTGIWLGIALFTIATIFLGWYLVLHSSSLALILFTQFIFHGIIKLGFLAYFIYKTPNLYNFVMNSFQLNLVNPVNDLGTKFTSSFASFTLTVSNRIDVVV